MTAEMTSMKHLPLHFDSCPDSSKMLGIVKIGFTQMLAFFKNNLKHMNSSCQMSQEGQVSHRHKNHLSEFVVHISRVRNLYFLANFKAEEPVESG